jgi:hypothetical protein
MFVICCLLAYAVLVKGQVSPGLCLACAYAAMAVAGASLTSIASGLVALGSSSFDSIKDASLHEVYYMSRCLSYTALNSVASTAVQRWLASSYLLLVTHCGLHLVYNCCTTEGCATVSWCSHADYSTSVQRTTYTAQS